jgi:hypothetical protein
MAQLTDPIWKPATGNPLPCSTTIEFTVTAGRRATAVRVRYALRPGNVKFVLPSPVPADARSFRQTSDMLVDDYQVAPSDPPASFKVSRTVGLESAGGGQPALESVDVIVGDLLGDSVVNEHSSTAAIAFAI